MKVLYLTYDGLCDPLGQSQILPYLTGLAGGEYDFHVISFEKADRPHSLVQHIQAQCDRAGIVWHPRRYTKSPPVLSSAWDLARMHRLAMRLHRIHGFAMTHCRSYLPAVVGLSLKRRYGVRFLFDMRGFWPDEKVESGAWNLSNPAFRAVYRFFKRKEAEFMAGADAIVSLTRAGITAMRDWPGRHHATTPTAVIPCSADFSLFTLPTEDERQSVRTELGIDRAAMTVVYLGSIGGMYMLDEMMDFFRVFRTRYPGSRLLMLTPGGAETVTRSAISRGVDPADVIVRFVARDQLPRYLAAADLGLSFIRPSYAKLSSSPTKVGEYWAAGIPAVVNGRIGDMEELVQSTGGGFVIDSFDESEYNRALDHLELHAQQRARAARIRQAALPFYGLDTAVSRYRELYARVLGSGSLSPLDSLDRPSPERHAASMDAAEH